MRAFFREFFRIGNDFQWEASGFMSWQHLTFATALVVLMVVLAVVLGRRNRLAEARQKNRVLIWSAILIDGFELIKIIISCTDDPSAWTMMLLFLCSIQLIVIPLAAFSKGRVREASLDFVSIFGLLGALLGTYGAAQNYNAYPVLYPAGVIGLFFVYIVSFYGIFFAVRKKRAAKV